MPAIKLVPNATSLPASSASVKAARLSLARSESTLFPTRLALARWTAGGDVPHLRGNAGVPMRADWFIRAERDFQAWLDSGGFVQHDHDDAPQAVDLADSDAQGTAPRLRIVARDGDAV